MKRKRLINLGNRISQRKLTVKRGTYGPTHDPYAYEELTVAQNGWKFKLHMGLDVYFSISHDKSKRSELEVAGYRASFPPTEQVTEECCICGGDGHISSVEYPGLGTVPCKECNRTGKQTYVHTLVERGAFCEGEAVGLWQAATGMTVKQFYQAYDRVHPWFDDPRRNHTDQIALCS